MSVNVPCFVYFTCLKTFICLNELMKYFENDALSSKIEGFKNLERRMKYKIFLFSLLKLHLYLTVNFLNKFQLKYINYVC